MLVLGYDDSEGARAALSVTLDLAARLGEGVVISRSRAAS